MKIKVLTPYLPPPQVTASEQARKACTAGKQILATVVTDGFVSPQVAVATVGSSNAGVSPEMVQSQACLKAASEALCKSLSTGCAWDKEGKTCASSLTAGMSGAGVFFLLAFIAFVVIASVFYVRNPAEFAHHRSVAMARLRQWAGKDAKVPLGSSHARRNNNNNNNNNAGRAGVQLPAAAGGVGAAGMSGGGGGLRGQGTQAAGVTAAGVTAAGVRVQMKQPRVGALPNNWEAIYDEASNDTYFYHAPTGRTQVRLHTFLNFKE